MSPEQVLEEILDAAGPYQHSAEFILEELRKAGFVVLDVSANRAAWEKENEERFR